jgi:hypothetical protein
MDMHDYTEAIVDFQRVIEVDPDNKAAKNQIAVANTKIKQIFDKEKKTYAGMFQKFAAADAKVGGKMCTLFVKIWLTIMLVCS